MLRKRTTQEICNRSRWFRVIIAIISCISCDIRDNMWIHVILLELSYVSSYLSKKKRLHHLDALQALSLLLSIILRAMVSSRTEKHDSDDENPVRGGSWPPLINSQGGQASALTSTDSKGIRPHTWSTRMRQKVSFV